MADSPSAYKKGQVNIRKSKEQYVGTKVEIYLLDNVLLFYFERMSEMLRKIRERFFRSYKGPCVILGENSVILKTYEEENCRVLGEFDLPNYSISEDEYLQKLAEVLREELSWLGDQKDIVFLLESYFLEVEDFYLPIMPTKEEKAAIAWELSESLNLKADEFYYITHKEEKSKDKECLYTVYGVSKSLIEKLIGMAHGFGFKPCLLAPNLEGKVIRELFSYDLLPKDLINKEYNDKMNEYSQMLLKMCIVLTLSVVGLLGSANYYYGVRLQNLEDELQKNSFWHENFRVAKSLENETRNLNSLIEQLDAKSIKRSKLLEALGRSSVAGVWLKGVESDGEKYRVRGNAIDMLGINAWVEEVPASSEFKNVKILSTEAGINSISFVAMVSEK